LPPWKEPTIGYRVNALELNGFVMQSSASISSLVTTPFSSLLAVSLMIGVLSARVHEMIWAAGCSRLVPVDSA
jgi:hypothetical protein